VETCAIACIRVLKSKEEHASVPPRARRLRACVRVCVRAPVPGVAHSTKISVLAGESMS
jgi:hypothetical protein